MTEFDFTAEITSAKAELEGALAELSGLREAHTAAEAAARNARERFSAFVGRFNAAIRNGADKAAPMLERMLDDEQRRRDAANSEVARAKHVVDNAIWHIDCLRAGVRQLELAANPPLPERFEPAAALRSKPAEIDDHDVIIFPPGRAA
jgi:hypothetical protein